MNTATGAHRNPDKTLSKLKSGDDCAFNELVQSHWEKIYNRANGLLGNRQDAEEVAQDTFLRARKSICNFRGTAPYQLGYTILQPTLPETSIGIGGGGNVRSRSRWTPQSPKTRTLGFATSYRARTTPPQRRRNQANSSQEFLPRWQHFPPNIPK